MRIFLISILIILLGASIGNSKIASIIGDPITGEIYFKVNENTKNYPASLTKMMTLYIIFDLLKKGEIELQDKVKFSHHAVKQQPSKLNIPFGQSIIVEEIIEGLIIKSGNDAAVAIAEKISGSEKKFVQLMNTYVRKLNMDNTNFANPNGLPNKLNLSTAKDMFKLGSALFNDFPSFMKYFNKVSTSINGVRYSTHNKLVSKYSYYKGLKTGYIRKSGFQIALLGIFNEKPLLGIYFGGNSSKERNNKIHYLMTKVANENLKDNNDKKIKKINPNKKFFVQTSSFKKFIKSKIFLINLNKNNLFREFKNMKHHIEKRKKYFVTITEVINLDEAKKFCEVLKNNKLDCLIKSI